MNNTNSAGVLAVLDPQAELGVKQSTKNANAGFVDWRDWCAYIGKAAQARTAVADIYVQRDAMAEALMLYAKAGVGNSTDFHIQAQAANAARAALAGNGKDGVK